MSGGAMEGNCATGRPVSATAPMITVRIAMTIATMGRLIKNLDIGSPRLERLRIYDHAGPNLLQPFDDDALARLYAIANDPLMSDGVAERCRANRDFVGA